MKKILTMFVALILVAGLVSVAKSADIDTSYSTQGATGHAKDRHIVQSSDGTIVVLYQRGTPPSDPTFGISARKSTDNGATWTDLAGVPDSSTQVADTTYSEFSICIDTNDNIYVTYHDYNDSAGSWQVYFRKLTYSAGTWTVGSEKTVSGSSDEESENPSIIRESGGRIWVAYGYEGTTEGWLMATYSDDEFQTRTNTNVSLSDPDYTALGFHPALVIRNGYPFIVYHNSEEGDILWWSSWNGSNDWSTPQQVSTIDCNGNNFSVTMIGSDVHVVASRSGSMRHTYYNGSTWQTPVELTSSGSSSPSLTTNNVDLWCFASINYPDLEVPYKYNIKYKRRRGSTWDSTWTAITTDNTWNYNSTTPSIVTGDIPFAWTWGGQVVFPPPYTVKFGILTGPPAPPNVDDGVSGWSSDNTPTFNWDEPFDPTSGIEGYWWAVDDTTPDTGGTWTTARTATTAPLSDETHTFYVKARNGNGLTGSAGSHVCYIDRVPPTGTILINNGDVYTNSTSVTLNLSASDSTSGVSKMRFSNDGGSWSSEEDYAATKSWTLTASDGTKIVYVQYKDNAGNWSTPPLSISDTIILDITPPADPTLALSDQTTGSATYTNSPTVDVVVGNDSDAVVWLISETQSTQPAEDDPLWGSEPATFTLSAGNGPKTVYIWVKDAAGNINTGPVSDTITLDTIAPADPTLALSDQTTGSATYTNSPTVDVVVGNDSDAVVWLISETQSTQPAEDDPLWGSEPATFTLSAGNGPKTVYIWVKDAAGNMNTGPVSDTITLDATAPADPTLALSDQTTGSATYTNSPTVDVIVGNDSDAVVWLISESQSTQPLENDPFWSSEPATFTLSAGNGPKTVYIWVKDAAGNMNTGPVSDTITLDAIAPDTSIDSYPPDPTNSTSATFTFSANESGCEFSYQLDDGGWSGYNSSTSKSYLSLSPGSHTFDVRAKDEAGNEDAIPASYTWVIDTTAPDTSIDSYPPDPTNSTSATFTFSANESGCEFSYQLDGGGWSAYNSATTKSYTGLSGGSHTFEVKAKDEVGNEDATPASYTWVVDTTVPDTSIDSYPPDPTNSTSATFTFSANKSGCEFSHRLDGGVWSVYSTATTKSYTGLISGSHTFDVRAKDGAGNEDPIPASYTWVIDTTAPDTSIDNYPPDPTDSTSATFTFSASESGCEFSYQLDGGGWSGYGTATTKSYTGLIGGTHIFEVKAKDEAGNEDATPASYIWEIDTTAPDTSIDSYPLALTNSTSATFTFSASESGCEFSYQLDGGGWSAYSPATTRSYTGLSDGSHTFEVRAKDEAGNEDATPASYTWVIDTTAPNTSIDSYPPDPTNSITATFTFSANESGCEFSYQLDGGGWSAYSPATTRSYTGLTPGTHTFEVRAKDEAGNEDATPASYTWVIDTTAPNTSIDSYPPDPTNNTSATFSFSANESGCEFSHRLDGGGWSAYSPATTRSYTGLSEGTHTFEVKAKDEAGNEDATPASYTWVIDTTIPDTSIDSYPPDPTNSTSATFTFSANESGCEFSYRLDGGGWSGYSTATTRNYTGLTPGSHTFEVKAKDETGNEDATPASYTWLIDTTAPDTSITSYPPDPTNSISATFAFSASESGCEFSYQLDGGGWSGYGTGTSKSYTGLSEGSHTFEVKAKDEAGNEDATPASYTWEIDTTPPNTSIDSYPPDPTNSITATFTFSANESGCEFSYQLDGGGWSVYNSATTRSYTGLSEGTHTFEVKAKDGTGNEDATPASYTWVIDTTIPDTSIDSYPPDPTNSTSATLIFSASESGCEFSYQLDGGGWSGYSTATTRNYTGLTPGSHTFEVKAKDGAGNEDATPASYTWVIDTTAPDTSIDSYPSDPTNSTSATFTFSASESGCEFSYQLDGGGWSGYSSATTKSYTGLSGVSHTFEVKAKDGAGNEDATPASYTWLIDTTAPNTSIDSYPPDPTNSTSATFTFSANESGCEFSYQLDGGGWSVYNSATTKSYTGLSGVSHTFEVKAKDGAGNEDATPASYIWVIDTTIPDTSIDSYPPDPTNSTSATFTFSANKSGCEFSYRLDGGGWSGYSTATTGSYTGLTGGSHTFEVKAKDGAGNEDPTPASYTWLIDTTAPDTSIDNYPPDPTNSTSANFTFSASESGCEFSYQLDGGGWSGYNSSTSKSYLSLSPGSHTFDVRARDEAGNEDSTPASYTWEIDTTPPNTSIDSYPPDPTNSITATFTFSANESGCEFSYQLDGGGWSLYNSATTRSYAGLTPGSHTFEVKAKDDVGNEDATPASYTWVIDTAVPDTSIDSYPPDPTNSTSATFTFSANKSGCEFSYRLDGGGWSVYDSATTKSYAGLTPGSHTFDVKAKDGAGNEDPIPASYTWLIDTTAPDTSIDNYPPDPTNSTSANFTFSASEGGCEFSYQLDGGGWSGYGTATSKSYTGLAPGIHIFEVKARDGAGNEDATPASYIWVIDTTIPNTTIDSYPPDPTNSTSATFTFSANESGCEFSYQLDGGGWSGYSAVTTRSYTGLSEGSHTFEVRARDAAGNEDATPASYIWVIDATIPNTTIDSYPPDPTNSTSATFTFSANESGCEFSYQLDGGGWSGYGTATTKNYTGLTPGSHTFEVKAKDGAGNEDATPASYTWVIDTTAPDTSITSYPPDPTNSTSATFSFSANESGCEFSYRLDSGGWSGYSPATTRSYAGLSEGTHTFEVRAKDTAGNEDATPASYTWVIDTAIPDTSIDSYPPDPTNSTSATFTFSASESGCEFSYRLDGGGWSGYSTATTKNYTGLTPGSHTFEVKAKDGTGNEDATPASYTWLIDTTAPDTSITSYPPDPTNSTSATFVFSASESGCEFSYQLDGGGWSGYGTATSKSYTGLIPGSHTFEVRAKDTAGNEDPTPASYTWVIDTIAPDTIIDSYPPDPTNSTSATFIFSASESGCEFSYQLDGGGWSVYNSATTRSYTGLSGGSHTFEVKAKDGTGNEDATPASYTWVIDTTAPDTTIDSYPSNPTNSASATFVFSASESGCEFSYQLDGGGWSGYSPATTRSYAGLSGGNHTFEVKARDTGGNEDPTPASYTWVIDTTIPDTSITSYPLNPTNSTSATFTFSASESGCEFSYQLDGGGWSGYGTATSKSYTGLSGGTHTFEVRAKDGAGNEDATPASYTWVIDTTIPDTSIDSYPPDPTNSTSATFTFSASESGCEFSYQLDGGGWSGYSSATTRSYTGLSEGSHTFEVKAKDGTGNEDPTPASYTWVIDITAPDTSIDSYPPDPTNSTSATFTFSASESGCEFSYRLDGGVWSGYSPATTRSYTGLSGGNHTFEVRARDEIGNEDATPASYTWVIDITAPDTSIDSYPPDPTNSTSATFIFSASESGCEFSYRLDGGVWSGYSPATSRSYTGLSGGNHTFEVKAKDVAGNEDATPALYTWVIDTTAPDTTIDSYPSNPTNNTAATFTFSASESGCEFSYRLDGGVWSGYSTGATRSYSGLSEGTHTFEVRAKDGVGNEDLTPASYTWVIDTTAPDTIIDSYPPDPANSASATFIFSASESGCEFSYRLDGGVWSGYNPATSRIYTGLSDGSHTFEVKARDGAGNEDLTPASYTWVIDTTIPDTSIDTYPPDPANSTSATFTFSANKSGCEFSYRLDGGVWSGYSTATTRSYTGLGDGTHTFEVKAKDGAGNEDPVPASYTWVIDTTAPDTSIDSYPPDPTNSTSATFIFSANESGCEFSYRLDGGGWSGYNLTATKSYLSLAPGTHMFEVKAKDGTGNEDPTPASYTWVIDTTAPDTSITSYPPDPSSSASATFIFSANESGCEFSYQLDGGGWSGYGTATTRSYTGLGDGTHTFEVKARDRAGNEDPVPASYTWVIDLAEPDGIYQITSNLLAARTLDAIRLTIALVDPDTLVPISGANNPFIITACTISDEDAPGNWTKISGPSMLNNGRAVIEVSYDTVGKIRFKVSDNLGYEPGYTAPIDIAPWGLRYDLEAPERVEAGREFPLIVRLIDIGAGNPVTPSEYARQVELVAYSSPVGTPAEGELKIKSFYLQGGEKTVLESYSLAHVIYIEASDAEPKTPQSTPGRTADIEVIGAPKTVMKFDGMYREMYDGIYLRSSTRIIIMWVTDIIPEPILYRDNGGDWKTYVEPFTLSPGAHTIEYYGIDKYGNKEMINRSKKIYVTFFGGGVTNIPNPFKAGKEETWIEYDLKGPSNVTITIYDLFGQEVWHESYASGENGGKKVDNSVAWDGRNLSGKVVANGGYICRIWIEKEKRHMLRKIAVAK